MTHDNVIAIVLGIFCIRIVFRWATIRNSTLWFIILIWLIILATIWKLLGILAAVFIQRQIAYELLLLERQRHTLLLLIAHNLLL